MYGETPTVVQETPSLILCVLSLAPHGKSLCFAWYSFRVAVTVAFDICVLLNIYIREDEVKEQCLATGAEGSEVCGDILNFQSSFQFEINPRESYHLHRDEISA